ncbi:MAG: ribbon-helix-helix protein, CopG family [Actinomycetota bacterium]
MSEPRPVKQFNVYITVDTIRAVKHHAVETEQSLSAIVETALTEHLARRSDYTATAPTKRKRSSNGH